MCVCARALSLPPSHSLPSLTHKNIEHTKQALADRKILRQGTCRKKIKKPWSSSWSSSYTLTLTPGQLLLAPNSKVGASRLILRLPVFLWPPLALSPYTRGGELTALPTGS